MSRTCNATFLVTGILLGIFIQGYFLTEADSEFKYVKRYDFPDTETEYTHLSSNEKTNNLTIKYKVSTPYIGFNGRGAPCFTIEIHNQLNKTRWIPVYADYFRLFIWDGDDRVHDLIHNPSQRAKDYDLFLAPDGVHTVTVYWNCIVNTEGKRSHLEDGRYYCVAELELDGDTIMLDPVTFDVRTERGRAELVS